MNFAFDTHEFYKKLQSANFTSEQAEAITELVKATQKASFEEIGKALATKNELFEVKTELTQEILEVKSDLKLEIFGVKAEVNVLKWMMAFILAGIGSLVIKAFFV